MVLKKTATLLLLFSAISLPLRAESEHSRIEKLEAAVRYLSEQLGAVINQVNLLIKQQADQIPIKATDSSLKIARIDTFYNRIYLSNGMGFHFSEKHGIDHWLVGQPIKVVKSEKKGYVKIINIDIDESIEVKRID